MLSLPASSQSPSPSPPPLPPLQPKKHVTPMSLNQIIISKQSHANSETRTLKTPNIIHTKTSTKQAILRKTKPRRTNPIVWCSVILCLIFSVILCLIFSLILIFFGISTFFIFLVVKPKIPLFDTPNTRLSTIYFNPPKYLNGDFTFLANFLNPDRKLDVRFDYLTIELYFVETLISTQSLPPLTQRPRKTRSESIHLISSLVYLPQNHAVELKTQVHRINCNIRATFKVRATLGILLALRFHKVFLN